MTIFYILICFLSLMAMLFIAIPLRIFCANAGGVKYSQPLGWTCLLFLPVFAWVVYFFIGNHQALEKYLLQQQEMPEVATKFLQMHNPLQIIRVLNQHLQQDPKSAQGWYLLSHLYYSTQQPKEALQTAKKAYELAPNNVDYAINFSEISFLENNKQLSANIKILLLKIQKLHPERLEILNLLALNAYHKAQYEWAIHYWEQLLQKVPADSTSAKQLLILIGRAENQLKYK